MTAALLLRLDRLESENAIRSVMADYMRFCDRLDAATPMRELGDLFAEDAIWAGRGARYSAGFGVHRGRKAIVAMLDRYRVPEPHFTLNAHFLTSEKIDVHGDSATGGWMMLQIATYASGASDLRGARLYVDFMRRDEHWKIQRFETENLFSRPVDRWDDPSPLPVPTTLDRGE